VAGPQFYGEIAISKKTFWKTAYLFFYPQAFPKIGGACNEISNFNFSDLRTGILFLARFIAGILRPIQKL
jgi:hypothetical protein